MVCEVADKSVLVVKIKYTFKLRQALQWQSIIIILDTNSIHHYVFE
jgi:hypothetical protein